MSRLTTKRLATHRLGPPYLLLRNSSSQELGYPALVTPPRLSFENSSCLSCLTLPRPKRLSVRHGYIAELHHSDDA